MDKTKILYLELQRLRESKKITQSFVADRLGFTPSSISHVEIGQKNLSVTALINWMDVLNIDLVSIVSDANKGVDYELIHKAIENGIDVNEVIKNEIDKIGGIIHD